MSTENTPMNATDVEMGQKSEWQKGYDYGRDAYAPEGTDQGDAIDPIGKAYVRGIRDAAQWLRNTQEEPWSFRFADRLDGRAAAVESGDLIWDGRA